MARVYFASDHAGFELKGKLVEYVRTLGHEALDLGAHERVEGDDYPDYVTPCALRLVEEPDAFAILLGGSGQGEAMAANRVAGVRAAVYYGEPAHPQTDADGNSLGMVESERAHNDANALSLGARFITEEEAKAAVERFLKTPFSGVERHRRRLAKF